MAGVFHLNCLLFIVIISIGFLLKRGVVGLEAGGNNETLFVPDGVLVRAYLERRCRLSSQLRPQVEGEKPLAVQLRILLLSFRAIDDNSRRFSARFEIHVAWQHPCATWGNTQKTAKWAHIKRIEDKAETFWRPKFNMKNAYRESALLERLAPTTPVFIYKNGTFIWQIITNVDSFCQLKLRRFPFDVQNCSIVMESYYESDAVELSQYGRGVYMPDRGGFIGDGEIWHLSSVSMAITQQTYPSWNGNYHRFSYYFTFQRKHAIYVLPVLLPSFGLLILQLFSGFLPPDAPQRSQYNAAVLLALFFLQHVINKLTPASSELPYLKIWLGCVMANAMICTFYALISCRISRTRCVYRRCTTVPLCRRWNIEIIRLVDLIVFGGLAFLSFAVTAILFILMFVETEINFSLA